MRLETAYVHLSQFQEGVGERPIDCNLPSGIDPQKTLESLNLYLRFSKIVADEAALLLAEFTRFKTTEIAAAHALVYSADKVGVI